MAYTFDQVFAADPANPSNVAQNASITIFAPGDGTMTPLTITDPDGQPLANPITVNANGFASAFAHATLDRVAWQGGGFTGYFTSYEGMKEVAVAAQTAAETAAADAGAAAGPIAEAAVATVIAEAEAAADSAATAASNAATAAFNASASATSAANAAALVGAPADTAVETLISTPASATAAALNATYAPLLDSIVQNLPKVADVYALAPAPTITLSAASAATSISGGVDRVPKRKTVGAAVASPADLEDPNFRYIGAYTDSLAYGGSFPDYDYIGRTYLTGGASQAALIRPTYSFVYTGRYLEIKLKALTVRSLYMLKIDGLRVTEDAAVLTTAAGSIYRLIIDFGSSAIRKVEFLSENMNFGGVTIEPTASLYRGPKPRRIGMAFGDSISAGAGDGAGGASYLDTSAHRVLDALGCDAYVNTAIGGTRYTGPGTDMSTFINRLPDITAIAPDVLVVWGSYNDAAVATGAEIETAATTFLNAVKAALPRTLVIVLGCYTPGNPTNAALWAANTAVKNAAATAGYPFVDVLDPLNLKATTPVWAASTAYRNGDIVQNSNAVYACIQGHTSTGTFDAAKFRGMSWINGTGKVGSTTGLGNSDTFILSDGVHPTLEGHTYLERRELESIVGKLRQIAGH